MGSSSSAFSEQELEDYQELTYFTKKEILHVHKRFAELDPEAVAADRNAKLPKDTILELQELKVNPFRDRICEVFSSSADGDLTFEDFLDMMSVFSDNAPKTVKVEFAFRIYDFDGDDRLSPNDLRELINRLTSYKDKDMDEDRMLEEESVEHLIEQIYNEADLDNDKSLSFAEFEHVITKAPDFVNSFRIRL